MKKVINLYLLIYSHNVKDFLRNKIKFDLWSEEYLKD